jgi:hypothetical protein
MLAFVELLIQPAKDAGMKVPEDCLDYDYTECPHFHVYAVAQLGRPMPWPGAARDNAKVVAAISAEEIRTVTYEQLVEKGFAAGYAAH